MSKPFFNDLGQKGLQTRKKGFNQMNKFYNIDKKNLPNNAGLYNFRAVKCGD